LFFLYKKKHWRIFDDLGSAIPLLRFM